MKFFNKALLSSALVITGGLGFASLPAAAHHSFSATFQADAKITVEGVVTKYSFKNPHVLTTFEVTNDDGSKTSWVVEGSAATLMRRSGWSADTFEVGDYIQVTGDSTHDGSPMVGMDRILVLDASSKELRVTYEGRNQPVYAGQDSGAPARRDAAGAPFDAPTTRPDGTPNLSLAWAATPANVQRQRGAVAPMTPAGEKKQAAFILADDPQVFCDPPGVVRQAGMTPHPFEVIQKADTIEIKYEEYGSHRIIPLGKKGDKPIDSGVKTHLGDAIAYYDGDALVIETINILENHSTPNGTTISDQASTVERMVRADDGRNGAVISYEMIVTDPLYFAEPVSFKKVKSAIEDYEMIENDCQAPLRDRNMAHPQTSFFLTSVGAGDGANLGGLEGADAHCEALADSVNVGDRGWRAYLSTTGTDGMNAIDRIGMGPWYNSRGVLVAKDKAALIEATGLTKTSVLSEGSLVISGRGDDVNRHDILTGTQNDGTALDNGEDTTCSNWTSNGEGSALAGHHDRIGGGADATSWTHAHGTRGCSQENLQATGGDGLFYCFATVHTTSESRVDSLVPAQPGAGAPQRGQGGGMGGGQGNAQGGMGAAGMGEPGVTEASAMGVGTTASYGNQADGDNPTGGKGWLWAFIGLLLVGVGAGFAASRKSKT